MHTESQKELNTIQLPLMYIAPNRSLAYVHTYTKDLNTYDRIRAAVEMDGASIKLLYTYYEADMTRYAGNLVLDVTEAKRPLNEITDNLNRVQGVLAIRVEGAATGLTASEMDLLQVTGTPVIVIARHYISNTFRQLTEALGAQVEELLFNAGKSAGQKAASGVPQLSNDLGAPLSPDSIKSRFNDLQVFGWSEIISLDVDDSFSGEVLLADDFEVEAWQGQSNVSRCNWLRGFINGALSSLEGRQFEVTEVECQAKGDKYCKMVFRPH